jgi:hypothetical protein
MFIPPGPPCEPFTRYHLKIFVLTINAASLGTEVFGTTAGLGYLVKVICPCKSPHWAVD